MLRSLQTLQVAPSAIVLASLLLVGEGGARPSTVPQRPAVAGPQAVSRTLFVDADAVGAADGSSWANAYTDLQLALDSARTAAGAVDSVWVAEGTYVPAVSDRRASFVVPGGIALVGGFAGTEATADEREPGAFPTVLSGDIGVPGDSLDNSLNVVRIEGAEGAPLAGVLLDGLTVAHGYQGEDDADVDAGAGLSASYLDVLIRACRFERNAARYSGGLAVGQATVVIEDVAFVGNRALVGAGASIGFSEATLRHVVFEDNHAGDELGGYGGGLYVAYSPTSFEGVAFERNSAGGSGGGLYVEHAAVQAVNVRFAGNRAGTGGGLHIEGDLERSRIDLANATFVSNTADYGSALHAFAATTRISNTTIVGNGATGERGGAVRFSLFTDAAFDNVILWGNGAAEPADGGFTLVPFGSREQVVFQQPTPGEMDVRMTAAIVERGCPELFTMAGDRVECRLLLNEDPLFATPPGPGPDGVSGTADDVGDLQLLAASPAVDFGQASSLPADTLDLDGDGDRTEPLPRDLAGAPREQGRDVDLGAFESPFIGYSRIALVDIEAEPEGKGRTWATAYRSLQNALRDAADAAGLIEQIWVAEGTYRPGDGSEETGGRTASFVVPSGVEVYGGFQGTEASRLSRDPEAYPTILSGEIQRDASASNNAHHVVTLLGADASTVLDGFTITGGDARGSASGSGGGLYVEGGRPTLRNLVVRENQAAGGGGAYLASSAATLQNVTFLRNSAAQMGGGSGGGLLVVEGRPVIANVRFHGNGAGTSGGGMRLVRDTSLVVNAEVVRNNGGQVGGGIEASYSRATLVNVVAVRNFINEDGGGLLAVGGAPRLYNSIVSGNASTEVERINEPALDIARSLIEGGFEGGADVLDAEPVFVRPPASSGSDYGDLRLAEGSPGIDYGRAAYLPADLTDLDGDGDTSEPLPLDLAGEARVQGSHVDLGPFESPYAVAAEEAPVGGGNALGAAYPNPSAEASTLILTVRSAQRVRVDVVDLLGRRVATVFDGQVRPGEPRAVVVESRRLPPGTYVLQASGTSFRSSRRLTVLR